MTRDSCVCCPYPLLTIPAVLSFVAFILTWIAATSCNFYTISYAGNGGLQIGLWTVETTPDLSNLDGEGWNHDGTWCTGWDYGQILDSSNLDGPLRTARAFGLMSGILASITFLCILIPSCVMLGDSKTQYLMVLCGLCIFTGVAAILDLVALASSLCTDAPECQLRGAGICSIVASVMWFFTAGLLYFALNNPRSTRYNEDYGTPAATPMQEQPMPLEQKDYQTVQNADGTTTKTTTTTVVNADGSKTVTQTTETIPADDEAAKTEEDA
jgi:hypothetical protein